MSELWPAGPYESALSVHETEHAIVMIKDFFQLALSTELNLTRVTAPLFVQSGTGLNDDLSGVEKPVSFTVQDMNNANMEIVHSLAKWKRIKLAEMKLQRGFGIYTDMNAIRACEELDSIHSLYVDQWDWETVIAQEDRTVSFLQDTVKKIYRCLKRTEFYIYDHFPSITPVLPEKITFLFAEDLQKRMPNLGSKEREYEVCKEYGAVFIIGIGHPLADGKPHDERAPDYDDWITETDEGRHGLNGDLLVWNPVLQTAMELSSMGIRVSPETLLLQLAQRGCTERKKLYFHSRLLAGELPLSCGGGIGQSRLCMYFLRKDLSVPVWYDFIMLLSYAFTGLLYAFVSLNFIEIRLNEKYKPAVIKILICFMIYVSCFGVYIGRFLRWNSWDVFANPVSLFSDVYERIASPGRHLSAWLFTFLLGTLLNLVYAAFKQTGRTA